MMQNSNWFFLEFAANSYIAVTVKRHAKIGVEPENVEKLSEQIVYLMRHTQVRKAFSTRALENSNNYKIQNIIKEWEHLFSVL